MDKHGNTDEMCSIGQVLEMCNLHTIDSLSICRLLNNVNSLVVKSNLVSE